MPGAKLKSKGSTMEYSRIAPSVKLREKVKIFSHTFVCEGVHIGDDVFVGHNVTFINDLFSRRTSFRVRGH